MQESQGVLFMTWQDPRTRRILPVARILHIEDGYEFAYIRAVGTAEKLGFEPFLAFPSLDVVYRTTSLPPLLSNRVMRPTRADYGRFLGLIGLGLEEAEPFSILARTGGRRTTDRIEVFAPPRRCGDRFVGVFLARGVRHVPGAEDAISLLKAGDAISLEPEPANPANPNAHHLIGGDGKVVGFLPDYLANELERLGAAASDLDVSVVRANPPPSPVHHRLLCSFTCSPTLGERLFYGDIYEPCSADATVRAA